MRLLLFPIILFALGGTLAWVFADQLAMPEDYAELVTWLRAPGDYAWAVGLLLILGDALLPLPSAPIRDETRLTPALPVIDVYRRAGHRIRSR